MSGKFLHGKSIFSIPSIELLSAHTSLILSTSLAVCLLCLLEGLSIGKSLSARAGGRIDTNQETFSIGMGNLGCAIFSGMPASGSLTHTLSVSSGAKSNTANLFTGLIILIGLLMLNDLVQYVPICALATLVIFIGLSLVKFRQIKNCFHGHPLRRLCLYCDSFRRPYFFSSIGYYFCGRYH